MCKTSESLHFTILSEKFEQSVLSLSTVSTELQGSSSEFLEAGAESIELHGSISEYNRMSEETIAS